MKCICFTLVLIATSLFYSCCGQEKSKDTLSVEAYSSFNNSEIPSLLTVTNNLSNYDSLVKYSMDLIGLPNSDIEILKTSEFGAFSVINRLSLRRFFIYSPKFFDSVRNVTKTDLAILSICFHELAHQSYRHPLKPSSTSHMFEKQADRNSGFVMCIIGATLEQSLLAIKNFGNENETSTHPERSIRMTEIERGFIDAKILIFKDSTYLKQDSLLKSKELMSALFGKMDNEDIENLTNTKNKYSVYIKKVFRKANTKQVYYLYGELIYITSNMEIHLLSNDERIGEVLQPNDNLESKILNLNGVKFYLEDQKIYSVNPDGIKLEVGNKITNQK